MKKFIAMLMIAVTVLAVVGCGSKSKEENESASETLIAPDGSIVQETTQEETNPENGLPLSKQPDPNAPVVDTVVVYAIVNGNMSQVMDSVDKLTEESLLDKLIELGTVGSSTKLVSFNTEETGETQEAGPGSSDKTISIKNGVLVLSDFSAGKGLDEETAKKAVADTFTLNYELSGCTVEIQ
ncbi:LptM family lipoprotein [Oribacterium sp. WCC10]|uniref:LptM family lipoprotein n=1 Tax=Oribacterium sp. WCC10 TaxID=1855343 RepID=UPI0008F0399E|nr:hypothetical protein [Oribacterium sp. WCC10]SFG12870.1 hypothetical protein SAMN05216356_10232 [Oribacterium sp. WCC10]